MKVMNDLVMGIIVLLASFYMVLVIAFIKVDGSINTFVFKALPCLRRKNEIHYLRR